MNAGGVLFFLVAGAVRACIDLMVLLLLGVRWLPGLSACLLAVNHCEFTTAAIPQRLQPRNQTRWNGAATARQLPVVVHVST